MRVRGGGSPGGYWGVQRRKDWRPGAEIQGEEEHWLRPEHPQTPKRLVGDLVPPWLFGDGAALDQRDPKKS